MSKFASFAEYPSRSLMGPEAALLTAWSCLHRYHSELAVVGGLAVKCLTKRCTDLLPGPVTMDVDLGVSLATEGGQYGAIADDLSGQGFRRDEHGRYVGHFDAMPVYVEQPKDAYDALLLVSRYLDGPEAAVAAFRAEKEAGNRGYARAAAALRQHFVNNDQSGPLRAAAFVLGDRPREPEARERERRIIEQVGTIGRALLGD